jgi:hypothetical protein
MKILSMSDTTSLMMMAYRQDIQRIPHEGEADLLRGLLDCLPSPPVLTIRLPSPSVFPLFSASSGRACAPSFAWDPAF